MCDFLLPALILTALVIASAISWNIDTVRYFTEADFASRLLQRRGKEAFEAWNAQALYRLKIFFAFGVPLIAAGVIWFFTKETICH